MPIHFSSFDLGEAVSINISTQPTPLIAAALIGFTVVLVLTAIFLFSLLTVALEARVGIVPLDNVISFSGE